MFKAPSKIIFNQDKKKEWEIHQQKIQNVKCSVDHLNSTSSIVRKQNHNFFQQLELQIQNDVHVKRLLSIQANSSARNFNLNYSIATNSNKTNLNSITAAGNVTTTNKIPHLGTLHQGFFKKQKQQRDQENQAIFRRIQETKSIFDVKKWEQEAEERKKILLVRSEFPQYYHQAQNLKPLRTSSDRHGSAFNFGNTKNQLKDETQKASNQNDQSGNVKSVTQIGNQNNMSSIFKDHSSLIDVNNSSNVQLQQTNTNNESIQLTDNHSLIGINNQQQNQEKEKFFVISNITVPSKFYHTMNSDTERTNYLKKLMRESRKIIYRKTAKIHDEPYFAEIKIEQGQFMIELENAKGEIYRHSIGETEGIKFYRKDCHEDINELFKRIQLNKYDMTIHFQKPKQAVQLLPIETKTVYKLRSLNQTKNFNSTDLLSKEGEIQDSDDDHISPYRQNKLTNSHNKSLDRNTKNQNNKFFKPSSSEAQLNQKRRLNSYSANQKDGGNKKDFEQIQSQNGKRGKQKPNINSSKELEQNNKINIQKHSNLNQKNKQPQNIQQNNNKRSQEKSLEKSKQVQNKNQSIKSQQNKVISSQQNNKNTMKNDKKVTKEQIENAYEDDYDEFDEEEEEEEYKQNQRAKNDKQNTEEEYEDPFEKFEEEEEEQKKKEELEKPNEQIVNHHPHEELNKKMIKFSFNDTGYKKNVSQESFQSKQKQNNNQNTEQHRQATPDQKKSTDNEENIKKNENVQEANQQNKKDEYVEYEEEFDLEEDSGTQYEINDADKEIIENKNQENKQQDDKQQKNNLGQQKAENQKDLKQKDQEDDYEEDFD
ncbi:hypothetical protein ABPG72_010662 [Tetrahymena utriculariae]